MALSGTKLRGRFDLRGKIIRKNASRTAFNAHHIAKALAGVAIAAFMTMMLINPSFYLDSARRGLSLYATSVLPSLFPFYFCSLLLTYIGAAKTISGLLGKPMQLLYRAPGESSYVLILSMLSGYPVGASMTAELYEAGVIDARQAKCIASFASTSGPIFMLGTVGSAIFGNVKIGAIVLAAHYLASFLNGFIYRMKKETSVEVKVTAISTKVDYDNLMAKTISASTINMLYVGGYIVLCGMIVDTITLTGLDDLIFANLGAFAQPLLAVLSGLIEMTRGCMSAAACNSIPLAVALSAGIVSIGGLSVTLQNYTFLSKCGMSALSIILRKFTQSIISFFIALGLAKVCGL